MFSKKFIILQVIVIAVIASFVVIKFAVPKPQLPRLGQVQDFTLIDSEGRNIGLKDLIGKVWLADFMFTTCGNICPMMTKNMSQIHKSYQMFDDVKMVSFSVNPENDQPEVLKKYAQKFNVNTDSWYFLTGSREELTNVAVHSFKLGDIKEPIFHSSYFTLVDRQGMIRGYYDGVDKNNLQKIAKDIRAVIMEK